MVFEDRGPLKRCSIHMKFSMTGQEKCDCLIEVTAWVGLTVSINLRNKMSCKESLKIPKKG